MAVAIVSHPSLTGSHACRPVCYGARSGQIGMMLCSKAKGPGQDPLDPRQPRQQPPPAVPNLNIPELRCVLLHLV